MISIKQAVTDFVEDQIVAGFWTEETRAANQPRLQKFAEWAPRAQQVGDVTTPMISKYRAHLVNSTWRGKKLAPPTVNKHLIVVGSMFLWAKTMGYTATNPAERIRVKDEGVEAIDKRVAIPRQHIEEICELGLIPRIMAYTGCRNTEALQLRVCDVREVQGILCLDFTASDNGQRRKSKAARRIIPIHRNLKPHILARIDGAHPSDPLSTDSRQGPAVSRSFNRAIQQICEESQPEFGPRITFTLYGLRHAWVNAMQEADTEKKYRKCLLGHSHEDLEDKQYGSRPLILKLHENMEKLPYGDTEVGGELRLVS